MWMSVAFLSPCVTLMPIVRILAALIVVPVKLDLLETEKHALVREYQNQPLFQDLQGKGLGNEVPVQ